MKFYFNNIQQLEKGQQKKDRKVCNRIMDIPEVYNVSDIYQKIGSESADIVSQYCDIKMKRTIYDSEGLEKILLELHKKLVTNYGKVLI